MSLPVELIASVAITICSVLHDPSFIKVGHAFHETLEFFQLTGRKLSHLEHAPKAQPAELCL